MEKNIVLSAFNPEILIQSIQTVLCHITQQVGHLALIPDSPVTRDHPLSPCTLWTTIHGDYHARLQLVASLSFFTQLTQSMLGASPTPEDIEDYAIEYFNVLCGHIVADIFRITHASAKFLCPSFCQGLLLESEPHPLCLGFQFQNERVELSCDIPKFELEGA